MRTRTALALAMLVGVGLLAEPAPARAATFTVNRIGDAADLNLSNSACDTSTNSGNQCTLRAAIQEANDTPGADTINFNITSTSKTITPQSPLPTITGRVTINGFSQANTSTNTLAVGNNATLRIVLYGAAAGVNATGLHLQANDSVIRGLIIVRFDGFGILVTGNGNALRGNIIGTNSSNSAAHGNNHGVEVDGSNNTVGGTAPAARNLISGNGGVGVRLNSSTETPGDGNAVLGNYIGTTKNGLVALGNGDNGLFAGGQSDCSIGDGTAAGRNVISANGATGIFISKTAGCTVRGNLIGTKADGSGDLGNANTGILVAKAEGVVIGGTTGPQANVVSGNGSGVRIDGSAADVIGNVVQANDGNGVAYVMGARGTVQGNVVLANGGNGVFIADANTQVNVTVNQIYANGALGINLVGGTHEDGFGRTFNDNDDQDVGPNDLQNFPALASAIRSNQTNVTTIVGSLNSIPNREHRIELFIAVADGSGSGEGQILVAAKNVTTNNNGDVSFTFVSGQLSPGTVLTATATMVVSAQTSEFSGNRTVVIGP